VYPSLKNVWQFPLSILQSVVQAIDSQHLKGKDFLAGAIILFI